jgi:hypothetical protein
MQNYLRLSIEGMHCEVCVRRVTAALQAVTRRGGGFRSGGLGADEIRFKSGRCGGIAATVNRIGFSAHVEK